MLLFFIFSLIYFSWRKLNSDTFNPKESIINRSWLASTVVLFSSQMNDITYYDGRISVMLWVLLAGLKNMIKEKDFKKI